MNFNPHFDCVGKHAFLSPSNYHFLRYDDEKLIRTKENSEAKKRGTELHEFAAFAIKLGRKQPRNKDTLNMYINDAIGYGMNPEQILYYSDQAFGTADAISFNNNMLRIHDLKTGVTPADMDQLRIYAAFFCLEYRYNPSEIKIELRIYQNGEIVIETPDPEHIQQIMDIVVHFNDLLQDMKSR